MDNSVINGYKQIDFTKIYKAAVKHKRSYFIVLPIVFVLACFIILSVPRYYNCTVELAPEISSMSGSSLTDLASSFGIDVSRSSSQADAISPELYPQLMKSVDFKTSLFPIKVKTLDGKISTSYYNYLSKYQSFPWWTKIILSIKKMFASKDDLKRTSGKVNSFWMTRKQKTVCDAIDGKIKCVVDKKTYVISLTVEDQDPLVCATMADSVKVRLQSFITEYRTNKAKNDMEYIRQLYVKAKADYEKARQVYGAYSDANTDLILQSFKSKQEDLENDMQLKYNAYSTLATQLQNARAKVQERTPVFTTLQSASVPLKAAGPKRMIFVGIMTILAFIGITIYSSLKEKVF